MSQQSVIASHYKILNKTNLASLTDANVKNFVDSLKKRNGKPLSENYKTSLLTTIKKENSNITTTAKKLGWVRKRNNNQLTFEIFDLVVKLVQYCQDFTFNDYDNITRTHLDTVITILLVVYLNSTVSNLYKLKVTDLDALQQLQKVTMKNGESVIPTPQFTVYAPKIRELLQNRSTLTKEPNLINIISVVPDVINKQIRLLLVMFGVTNLEQSWGLRFLEKLPKDILIRKLGDVDTIIDEISLN